MATQCSQCNLFYGGPGQVLRGAKGMCHRCRAKQAETERLRRLGTELERPQERII